VARASIKNRNAKNLFWKSGIMPQMNAPWEKVTAVAEVEERITVNLSAELPGCYPCQFDLCPSDATNRPISNGYGISISVGVRGVQPDNDLSIWQTNLSKIFPHDWPSEIGSKSNAIPITLMHTGYPVLDLTRSHGQESKSFPARRVGVAVMQCWFPLLMEYVENTDPEQQIFAPVFRLDRPPRPGIGILRLGSQSSETRADQFEAIGLRAGKLAYQNWNPDEPFDALDPPVDSLKRSLAQNPNKCSAYFWIAWMRLKQGKTAEAMDFLLTGYFRLLVHERLLKITRGDVGPVAWYVVRQDMKAEDWAILETVVGQFGMPLDTSFADLRREGQHPG
jgi:hypothetical protein